MGISLLQIPRGTHLINNTISSVSASSYTPSSRVVGIGINYTTKLSQQNTLYVPSTRSGGGGGGGQIPTQPTDPECDPEEYLQQKNLMFSNVLKYIDEYTTYNYLKVTNIHFNGSFLSAENEIPLTVNIVSDIDKLFYFRLFPDDTEICEDKLELVKAKLAADDYSLKLEVCSCDV